MPWLIKGGGLQQDPWQICNDDCVDYPPGLILISREHWSKQLSLINRPKTGLILRGDDAQHIDELMIHAVDLIALEFVGFKDGRPYSLARILRHQYAYTGELSAIGDVHVDQLPLMARCGMDSYHLRDDQDSHLALKILSGDTLR